LELQHPIKNNLQLVTPMIRLEARAQREGDSVNLEKLAGRIESLQLLYRDLEADGLGQTVDLAHYLSQIASAVMHTYAIGGIRLDRLQDGSGGDRVETARLALRIRTFAGLAQVQEPGRPGRAARGGRGLGEAVTIKSHFGRRGLQQVAFPTVA
jgi:hypothetical protein